MKLNKSVINVIVGSASKESISNLIYAIFEHVSDKYDCDGRVINNVLSILAGDKPVSINNINMDAVKTHSEWVYKNELMDIFDSNPINVDNITGIVTIEYKYNDISDESRINYTSTFDISYIDYPDIIINYEGAITEV